MSPALRGHLLIAGIPGTGKSTFGRWLAERYGFVHHDVDLSPTGFVELGSLVTNLMKANDKVVLDWGFPVHDGFQVAVQTIQRLQTLGLIGWWFDGDRAAAKESYLSLNKPEEAWNDQVAGIDSQLPEIKGLFARRSLDVIFPGPTFLTAEEKVAAMFDEAGSLRDRV